MAYECNKHGDELANGVLSSSSSEYLESLINNYISKTILWYVTDESPYIVPTEVPQGWPMDSLLWKVIYNEMIVFNDPEGATIVVIAGDLAVVVAAMWRPPN